MVFVEVFSVTFIVGVIYDPQLLIFSVVQDFNLPGLGNECFSFPKGKKEISNSAFHVEETSKELGGNSHQK